MSKIKVLIIDDSALIRSVMKAIIDGQPDMEVVGMAPDPLVARDLIKQSNPDVLTLDVEMPRMNGLEFLEKLMRLRPTPVVMISTLTEHGSEVTLKALELGAVDFVAKPKLGVSEAMAELVQDITDKIRTAARAHVRRQTGATAAIGAPRPLAGHILSTTEKVVFIGSSTGGTEALKEVLSRMPAESPAIMMTQHMPESFTKSFAARLDGLSAMTVKEAEHNERVLPGYAYLAPGHSHLRVKKSGAYYYTELSQEAPVNRHRPSVDVLFESAARVVGQNAVAVMLTGMGKDGAAGMLAMRQAGAYTIAQDEASCVVYGMPKAAVEIGAVQEIAPLANIAGCILKRLT
ncbi:chemotaxis response regulator protein-glutamate methylesterase [Parasulfuritortus cantonensis]|uniref:Protein-glutamate methylesterase/protein-glutamine glutaminase n=1 Tax=Parasulfuritortus cantonensis TaxID=2528202 RepID=A0A4V2NWF5_9PROT|nr:chemotaxis response regulator protein-glutamate methylesterase [Parasulfuritortus cantonensis]TCJ17152.1 chemotaxis response regulator protein-glutamate methylesterase [Parasulfuritortus cantonensis]